MRKITLFILIVLNPISSFAEEPACLDKTSYACYEENRENFCDARELEWNKESTNL